MAQNDQPLKRAVESLLAYEQTHEVTFLNEAISALEEVLQQEPISAQTRTEMMNLLGEKLWERYERTGDLRDLDASIERVRNLIQISGPLDEGYSSFLQNLGLALETRFRRTLDSRDIDEAIRCHKEAIELGQRRGLVKVIWLNNLANALRIRFHLDQNLSDLQEAIKLHEEVLRQTPVGSEDYQIHQANLGNDLLDLSIRSADTPDIDVLQRAIHLLQSSVGETGNNPSDIPKALGALAESLAIMALNSPYDPALFGRVTTTFRAAVLSGLEGDPATAMRNAVNWGNWAYARSEWEEAAEAFNHALKLSNELFSVQADRAKREAWLRETQGIGERMAFVLCELNRPDEAVIALERTLARILSVSLSEAREEFVTRFTSADFTPLRDQLIKAAGAGPLVYICCTFHGGVALVVIPEANNPVTAIKLPDLSEAFLDSHLRYLGGTYQSGNMAAWLSALDDVTRKFWPVVMRQVIEAVRGFSHATIIPVGRLALIPLHAAWFKSGSVAGARVFACDNLSLSYAPNAQVLTRASGGEFTGLQSILVVEDFSLQGASLEARSVVLEFQDSRTLAGEAAAGSKVLSSMGQYEVVHFCCHAQAEPYAPQSSSLLMPDGSSVLLSDVLSLNRVKTMLAVLSACETNVPGEILPDEAISFSTGLLEAGISSVVSSDWIVDDLATTLLMIRFYYIWRHEKQPATRALREAQLWLRDSTNLEKIRHLRDCSSDSIDPEARRMLIEYLEKKPGEQHSFEHPYYWAAFKWTGAVSV